MSTNILLLSPLRRGCGNYSTIKRIRLHLEGNGHRCVPKDCEDLAESSASLDSIVHQENIRLVIALHAFKAGVCLKGTKVPFILIFGGTDVNENSKDSAKLEIMTEVVYAARFVVSFSNEMLQSAKTLWPNLEEDRCIVIKQAVITCPSGFSIKGYLEKNGHYTSVESKKIFLFMGGIRPVKNPLYLVKSFEELHVERPDVLYVIVGPFLDEQYREEFEEQIKNLTGVVYLPEMTWKDAHASIKESFALVNSSESEGMVITILEAMHLGVPVIARDISGNRSLVSDGENGLLFTDPKDFNEKARLLLDSEELRLKIIDSAKNYVSAHHSVEEEDRLYRKVVTEALHG